MTLEDQKRLAIAAGYEDAFIQDNKVGISPVELPYPPNAFLPTSPKTLQQLRFNLKISVVWSEDDQCWWVVHTLPVYEHQCTTQAEIDQAIIDCAFVILDQEKR